MMYLADEMFKQKGNHFTVKIETDTLADFRQIKTPFEWAQWVEEQCYKSNNHKSSKQLRSFTTISFKSLFHGCNRPQRINNSPSPFSQHTGHWPWSDQCR